MCGRYYIEPEELTEVLRSIILEAQRRAEAADAALKTGEIFPSNIVPVLANSRSQQAHAYPMRWGMLHETGKNLVINARSETAQAKDMFRESTKVHRCIVPASWYYEWSPLDKTTRQKRQYGFSNADASMLCMVGLYTRSEGESLPRFVILTRPAAKSVAHIHNRMPVILPQEAIQEWLSPEGKYDALLQRAVDEVTFWDTAVA